MKWLATIAGGIVLAGVIALAWLVVFERDEEPGGIQNMIPTDLVARLIDGGDTVELSWSAADIEDVTLVVQRAERDEDDAWEDLAQFESGAESYTYTEPRTNTSYLYRIRAFDDRGGSGQTAVAVIE